MKILNLTPHPITIRTPENGDITVPPSGQTARVEYQDFTTRVKFSGLPGVESAYRWFDHPQVVGLPADDADYDMVLVSLVTLQAIRPARGRRWVPVAPDTGPTCVRENGQVVAVTQLILSHTTVCEACRGKGHWYSMCPMCGVVPCACVGGDMCENPCRTCNGSGLRVG